MAFCAVCWVPLPAQEGRARRAIAFQHSPLELRSEDEPIFSEVDREEPIALRLPPWHRSRPFVERYRHGELVNTRIVPV